MDTRVSPSDSSTQLRGRLPAGFFVCMILTTLGFMMVGLSAPVSSVRGGVLSVTLYAGTDISMKVTFSWETQDGFHFPGLCVLLNTSKY